MEKHWYKGYFNEATVKVIIVKYYILGIFIFQTSKNISFDLSDLILCLNLSIHHAYLVSRIFHKL